MRGASPTTSDMASPKTEDSDGDGEVREPSPRLPPRPRTLGETNPVAVDVLRRSFPRPQAGIPAPFLPHAPQRLLRARPFPDPLYLLASSDSDSGTEQRTIPPTADITGGCVRVRSRSQLGEQRAGSSPRERSYRPVRGLSPDALASELERELAQVERQQEAAADDRVNDLRPTRCRRRRVPQRREEARNHNETTTAGEPLTTEGGRQGQRSIHVRHMRLRGRSTTGQTSQTSSRELGLDPPRVITVGDYYLRRPAIEEQESSVSGLDRQIQEIVNRRIRRRVVTAQTSPHEPDHNPPRATSADHQGESPASEGGNERPRIPRRRTHILRLVTPDQSSPADDRERPDETSSSPQSQRPLPTLGFRRYARRRNPVPVPLLSHRCGLRGQVRESEPGYDCEFIEKPPKQIQWECPICLMVLREPSQLECCGSVYCTACILRALHSRNKCPLCNSREPRCFRDKRLKQSLSGFHVNCCHRVKHKERWEDETGEGEGGGGGGGEGCKWEGEFGELERHLNKNPSAEKRATGCLYTLIPCKFCTKPFQRKVIHNHQADDCQKRGSTCGRCGHTDTYENITGTHKDTCPQALIQCELCDAKFERRLLEAHRSKLCPQRKCECLSCGYSNTFEDVIRHMKDCCVGEKREDGGEEGEEGESED